jgi:TMEM175 potassium channel family protein
VTGRKLVRQLLELGPGLGAYLLSFLVIRRFWDYHRTFFRYIHLIDGRVVWTNMAMLLWITLISATAALLGSHWQEPAALVLYAVNLLLVTASLGVLWQYVSSAGYLRREGAHARISRYVKRYVGVSMLGFALAVLTASVSPPVSLALVFLTTVLARVLARRILPPGLTLEQEPPSSPRDRDAHGDDI